MGGGGYKKIKLVSYIVVRMKLKLRLYVLDDSLSNGVKIKMHLLEGLPLGNFSRKKIQIQ